MIAPGSVVLLTGAAGIVGTALRPALSDYRVRLHDRNDAYGELQGHEEAWCGDLSDFDAVRQAVDGCAAVVHLAGNRHGRAAWSELKSPNIDGAYNVFEACREARVRRVIFASSNHVTGMHDRRGAWPISSRSELAPDSLYAVSKIFGEALGRYYAGAADLSVVCLRIGWVTNEPRLDNANWRRMWLSAADLGQVVRKSLATNVHFGVYYAVSANTPLRYDLDEPRQDLGYHPADDSSRL